MAPALRRRRTKSFLLITCTSKAQSQDSGGLSAGTAQSQSSGQMADYQINTPITVTSQSTVSNVQPDGPLLAQEPFIDPFLEALRTRPVSPEEFGKTPQYTPRVGVPEPLPEPPPQNFYCQLFQLFKSIGSYIDNIFEVAPPACPTCVPA
jgi:hypothetical protein